MNINYMRTFLVVIGTGSFSATARQLGLTQPAVSMQVQALEGYFGAKLIERRGRRLELTRAGELAWQNITNSLDLVDKTRREIDEMATDVAGPVLLGASTVPGEHLCPTLLAMFMKRYPRVKPRLIIENTSLIVGKLQNHEIDLALVGAAPREADICVEAVFQDELLLLMPPQHRFVDMEQVPFGELLREPFISRELGSGSRTVMERYLLPRGVSLSKLAVVLEVGSSLAAVHAVEAGIGVALVSRFAAEKSLSLGLVVARAIQGVNLVRSLYLLTMERRYGGRAITEMATFLRSPEARHVVEGRRKSVGS